MDHLTKAYRLTDVKFDDDKGTVQAVIATLGVIDKDRDVTLPGFFGKQEVAIVWAHNRAEPVGKGVLFEDGNQARFDGKFFLETANGLERYKTVKAMGELQDWSYGFNVLPGGAKMGQQDGQPVQFLQPIDGAPGAKVAEVSPVLVGAGEGTGTTSIKSEGLRFVEQAEQVAQAVELLYARAAEIQTLRAEKGTALGDEAVARLQEVKTRLFAAGELFGTLVEQPPPEDAPDHTATMLHARRHLGEAAVTVAGR